MFRVAADSGKVGGCDNRDCLLRADCYDQSVAGDIQSSNQWNSGSCWLVLKPLHRVYKILEQAVLLEQAFVKMYYGHSFTLIPYVYPPPHCFSCSHRFAPSSQSECLELASILMTHTKFIISTGGESSQEQFK